MFRMCRHRFDLGFWGLPLEVAEKFCAGVFRKFISENTFIPVSEMNFRTVSKVQFFFVFSFVSHINRLRLFTGTCQATSQHASDRAGSPRLRRLDASGRRRSWRRHAGGAGDTVCAFHRTWWRGHLLQAIGVGWLGYLLPASERRRMMMMRRRRRSYRMLTLQSGRRRSRRSRRWIAIREGLLTLPC